MEFDIGLLADILFHNILTTVDKNIIVVDSAISTKLVQTDFNTDPHCHSLKCNNRADYETNAI